MVVVPWVGREGEGRKEAHDNPAWEEGRVTGTTRITTNST